MKEFFGIGGYQRPAEGFLSWQHLLFASLLMLAMVAASIYFGRTNRLRPERDKNRVLIVTAFLIDGFEIFKILMLCYKQQSAEPWLYNLPLFLCSIQLIAIPLAAFSHGRVKEAALDFVCIFGILGAVLGVYGAGQNYNAYPVLGFENVVSGITHSLAGFASLYIMISGMASLRRRNVPLTAGIQMIFCMAAYAVNRIIDYNYMFLMSGDGTPYDILYDLVGGHPVLYPLGVVTLFFLYIAAFYGVHFALCRRRATCPLEKART